MNFIDACRDGDVCRIKELLENGQDPTVYGNEAIQITSIYGYAEIVELLLQDERVDPTVYHNSAIESAGRNGHAKVVSLLLQDGRADPTIDNSWMLSLASYHGHVKVVEVLLQDGRVEPSDFAIKYGTNEIREMLIAYKYRVDGKEYQKAKSETQ